MASSRFWAAGESSDDDEGSAESDSEPEKVVKTATRWATVSDSESSDEGDTQRASLFVNLLHATHYIVNVRRAPCTLCRSKSQSSCQVSVS